jgi:hypothetical protein
LTGRSDRGGHLLLGLALVLIVTASLGFGDRPSAAQGTSASPTSAPAASPHPSSPAASPLPAAPATPAPLALWSPVDLAEIPFDYSCGGLSFKARAIADGLAIEDASPPILGTARFGGPSTHDRTWRVVADDGGRVTVAAVIDARAHTESPLYTVDLVRSPQGWVWQEEGTCSPWARFPAGLGGYWRLDPTRPRPSPGSRRLHLKVWHQGCQSGIRIRGTPQSAVTEEAVLVAIPVETTSHSDACSPGAPTRVTVRLPEPLGDRELYDAGQLPLRLVASKRDR